MRYLFGLLCVCALGLVPLVGCAETQPECEGAVDCGDDNECTVDSCDVASGMCTNAAVDDGAICEEGACQSGVCEPLTSIFPCTEQGIRDAIEEGGGPHGFDCGDGMTVLTQAEIAIDNDVILDGESKLTVDGGGEHIDPLDDHVIFSVTGDATAELRRFTVTGGGSRLGGGIDNEGTLTLTNTTVSGNWARPDAKGVVGGGISNGRGMLTLISSTVSGNSTSFGAGGILNRGIMTLTNTTVSGNTARGPGGGGIQTYGGTATLTNSTVSGNSTSFGAGGIQIFDGTATLTNSTVSGNTAGESGSGGGIQIFDGTATLTNSTVSGNAAAVGDGVVLGADGIRNFDGNVTLTNSTVSGSLTNDGDLTATNSLFVGSDVGFLCAGKLVASNGYNIESPGDTCGFDEAKGDQFDVTEAELNLGELADNGGPTMTHEPGVGSAAIDQIPGDACDLTEDQRGEPRPETGGTMCDVGSVEVQPEP